MEIHVLNGDALAGSFPELPGERITCREALIDGPVHAPEYEDFFFDRAAFISDQFHAPAEEYFYRVKREYDRLAQLADNAVVNLWFEHDLFCQVNLWFTIHFIESHSSPKDIFIVSPSADVADVWMGFGRMNASDLDRRYEKRVRLSVGGRELGSSLWKAFQRHDLTKLSHLSEISSQAFPLLKEVVKAHIDRYPSEGMGRPQRKLKSILDGGVTDFSTIFRKFWETEGIYGFGDTQVRQMLQQL